MDYLPIRRALFSVTRKDGLAELAALLLERQVELVSTGGTLKALREAGLPATPVSGVTNFPEILDGRVKTLHPFIHGGILADKDNPAHLATLAEMRIKPFDLVCVNLYDFASAAGLTPDSAIEEIDIGGPCLIRAASKNYHSVLVLPETSVYREFRDEFALYDGKVSLAFRRRMAARAFSLTADYDALIADYFGRNLA